MKLAPHLLGAALALATALGACDPVVSDAIDALGPEAPGVPRGPLHRPGQPCLLCHTGDVGDPPRFTVAGTVYQTASSTVAAAGATVTVTSSDGNTAVTTTNAAGNFYFEPRDYEPAWPIAVSVTFGSVTTKMKSRIGRDGSCAECHVDPASPRSTGHIYAVTSGGAP